MLTHDLTYTLTHSTCILSHLRTHSRTQTLWEDRAPQPTLESMERRGSETGRGRRLGPPDSPYGPGSTCPGPSGRVLPAPRPLPGSAGPHGPHVGGSVSVWGLSRDPRPRGRGLSLCPVLLPSWVLPPVTDAHTALPGPARGGHSTPPCWILVKGGLERTSPERVTGTRAAGPSPGLGHSPVKSRRAHLFPLENKPGHRGAPVHSPR